MCCIKSSIERHGAAQSLLTLSDGLLATAFGVKSGDIANLRMAIKPYSLIRPLDEPVRARRVPLRKLAIHGPLHVLASHRPC